MGTLDAVLLHWMAIDEGDTVRSLGRVVSDLLAATMAIVVTFELLRHGVAPHVTTTRPGSPGLRDFSGECLDQ
jgi:hypothetical protein